MPMAQWMQIILVSLSVSDENHLSDIRDCTLYQLGLFLSCLGDEWEA